MRPSEILAALERRCRGDSGGNADGVRAKALKLLPLLVASAPGVCADGGGRAAISGSLGGHVDNARDLSNAALKFISDELLSLKSSRGGGHFRATPVMTQNQVSWRRTVLTRALLNVLEVCYGESRDLEGSNAEGSSEVGGSLHSPLVGSEWWPWNVATTNLEGGDASGRPSQGCDSVALSAMNWPVDSFSDWGPRLADATSVSRSHDSSDTALRNVDDATKVARLVIRRHACAVWREALAALRGQDYQSNPGSRRDRVEVGLKAAGMLPLCKPLLKRICLDLPLLNVSISAHAMVFEAHGSLALLPCGTYNLAILSS